MNNDLEYNNNTLFFTKIALVVQMIAFAITLVFAFVGLLSYVGVIDLINGIGITVPDGWKVAGIVLSAIGMFFYFLALVFTCVFFKISKKDFASTPRGKIYFIVLFLFDLVAFVGSILSFNLSGFLLAFVFLACGIALFIDFIKIFAPGIIGPKYDKNDFEEKGVKQAVKDRLSSLKEEGIINEEEYEKFKAREHHINKD